MQQYDIGLLLSPLHLHTPQPISVLGWLPVRASAHGARASFTLVSHPSSASRSFPSPDAIISCGMLDEGLSFACGANVFFWLIHQRLVRTKIFCPSTSVSCCCRVSCIGSRSGLHCFGLIVIYIFCFDHLNRHLISHHLPPHLPLDYLCLPFYRRC